MAKRAGHSNRDGAERVTDDGSTRQALLRLLKEEQTKGQKPRWRRVLTRLRKFGLKERASGADRD